MTGFAKPATGGLDMSQFYRVFFEEAEEHLGVMERLLLALDPARPGEEDLNAIFRAAHSIKGGSGTFGFTDMTGVTHELESLLDKARRREIALTTEMVDALLAAGDVLKLQLARHRGDASAGEPAAAEACERIRGFVSGAAAAPVAVTPPPATAERRLTVSFPDRADESASAALVAELGRCGRIESRDVAAGRCVVRLCTAAGEHTLKEIFSFTFDPEEVEIAGAEAPAADPGYGLFADDAPAREADPGYGFFDDTPAAAAADPGYGFFTDAPAQGQAGTGTGDAAPPRQGRRSTDAAAADGARAGRRGTDKVAVSS